MERPANSGSQGSPSRSKEAEEEEEADCGIAGGSTAANSGSQGSPRRSKEAEEEEEADCGIAGGSTASAPSTAREQDMYVPIYSLSRLMKRVLPAKTQISKGSKYLMQECISEFISFITSEASDKCLSDGRKTISGDDVLWAMAILGFENYVEPLKVYLQHIKKSENDTKTSNVNHVGPSSPVAKDVRSPASDLNQQNDIKTSNGNHVGPSSPVAKDVRSPASDLNQQL